jgi:hypothetical protein
MIHGMDIPRREVTGFEFALARSQRMLRSIDLPIITVTTNAWELNGTGTHFSAMGVSAALHVLGGGFGGGLVASTASYDALLFPLDSTPASDPMLGGRSFELVHYGAAYNRLEKIRRLAQWDEAISNLRFCLEQPAIDGNCGRCQKCLATYLVFRVLDVEPRCFDPIPTEEAVLAFSRRLCTNLVLQAVIRAALDEAETRGLDEPWVKAARHRMRVLDARRWLFALSPTVARRAFTLYGRRPRRRSG